MSNVASGHLRLNGKDESAKSLTDALRSIQRLDASSASEQAVRACSLSCRHMDSTAPPISRIVISTKSFLEIAWRVGAVVPGDVLQESGLIRKGKPIDPVLQKQSYSTFCSVAVSEYACAEY